LSIVLTFYIGRIYKNFNFLAKKTQQIFPQLKLFTFWGILSVEVWGLEREPLADLTRSTSSIFASQKFA